MQITILLRSAHEIERLHTAAYRFAETCLDGLRPAIRTDANGAFLVAHITLDTDDAAQAFRTFWSADRSRRFDLAA